MVNKLRRGSSFVTDFLVGDDEECGVEEKQAINSLRGSFVF